MKRTLLALILISSIISQHFYNVGVLTYWLINHAYIASELCINRDEPEKHCDGKCYLKAKLGKDNQESSQSIPLPKLKVLELYFIFTNDSSFMYSGTCWQKQLATEGSQNMRTEEILKLHFHPPPTNFS